MSRFLQEANLDDSEDSQNEENQEQQQLEEEKKEQTQPAKLTVQQQKKNKLKEKKKKKKQEQKDKQKELTEIIELVENPTKDANKSEKVKNIEQKLTDEKIEEKKNVEIKEDKETEENKEVTEKEGADASQQTKNQKKKNKKKQKDKEQKKEEPEKPDLKKKGGKPTSKIAKLAAQQQLLLQQEEDRIRKEKEEFERQENERIKKIEEEERSKKEQKQNKKLEQKKKIEQMKKDGTYVTKEQLEERKRLEQMGLKVIMPITQTDEEKKQMIQKIKEEDKQKNMENKKRQKEKEAEQQKYQLEALRKLQEIEKKKIQQLDEMDEGKLLEMTISKFNPENTEKKTSEELKEIEIEYTTLSLFNMTTQYRCPIVAILGHVDTGKTTILDYIRNTKVQAGEAGGITQQIGATFFPISKIREEISKIQSFFPVDLDIPGIQVIDTPGHESFSNLRSRGSSLCDVAILVIDLMHGVEKQTLESIEILRSMNTPFVVALNKIDRLYQWKTYQSESSKLSLERQEKSVQTEFRERYKESFTQVASLGLNPALYWENEDYKEQVSIVPTSGITGEGLPDLLGVILHYVGNFQIEKISYKINQFKATVMEVKMIEGYGTTIDVILVDGQLKEGDKIVILGFDGPIVTQVRALVTPHPLKEMRVKNAYIHHKFINGAMGIKLCAAGLEKAVAGSELFVVNSEEEEEVYKKKVQEELKTIKKKFKLSSKGVLVAASTLGSLEALLVYLKDSDIPVSFIRVGHVSKEYTKKVLKHIDEHDKNKYLEYACILAFDVKVLPEAQEYAKENKIFIFTANIIYHLFDQYTKYLKEIKAKRKDQAAKNAIFPCIIKPIQFFNTKDPIVMGIEVVEGVLKVGTPVCTYNDEQIRIGVVTSMQINHKTITEGRKKDGAIGISIKGDSQIMAGRHFDLKTLICSIQSRTSFDLLKEFFRDEMQKTDWDLCRKLKPFFKII